MPERLPKSVLTSALARLVGADWSADGEDLGSFLEETDDFGGDDPTELVLDDEA